VSHVWQILLCVTIVVVFNSTTMLGELDVWTPPVQQQMVAEELDTLDRSVYEQSAWLSTTLDGFKMGVNQMHDYTHELFMVNESRIGFSSSPPPSYYWYPGIPDEDLTALPSGERASFAAAVWSRGTLDDPSAEHNAQALTDATLKRVPTPSAAATLAEQARAGHLDHVMRVVATNDTLVYIAFEGSEVYRQLPYTQLDRTVRSQQCINGDTVSHYTPLCRAWYQNTMVDTQGNARSGISFTPPLVSVDDGELFASIGRAIRDASGDPFAVVALDLPMKKIARQIASCQLPVQNGNSWVCERYSFGTADS
jgi:hypothetical protein